MNLLQSCTNTFKVLVDKNKRIYIYNCETKKMKESNKNVTGGIVRFYVITYHSEDTVKFKSIKKLDFAPEVVNEGFFKTLN